MDIKFKKKLISGTFMYIKTDFTEFLSLNCEIRFPFFYEMSPTFLELSMNMQGMKVCRTVCIGPFYQKTQHIKSKNLALKLSTLMVNFIQYCCLQKYGSFSQASKVLPFTLFTCVLATLSHYKQDRQCIYNVTRKCVWEIIIYS